MHMHCGLRSADMNIPRQLSCLSGPLLLQVSPDSGLLQCSTVADLVDFTFADGQVRVCYQLCCCCLALKL